MDIVDLREFYASPLGRTAQRLVSRHARVRWSRLTQATVLGLGFATPYLGQLRARSARSFAFMPARQGVLHWPAGGPWATALIDEAELPLDDASIDLALIVHGLELSDNLPLMLREIWRVLAPQGRALFVVPNRRGMWARFDSTPFGHGRPFSRRQLSQMLREAQFSPTDWAGALYLPPIPHRFFSSSAPVWERAGSLLAPGFSGILMVEAVKQVYAVSPHRASVRPLARLRPQILPAPAFGQHPRRAANRS